MNNFEYTIEYYHSLWEWCWRYTTDQYQKVKVKRIRKPPQCWKLSRTNQYKKAPQ